MLNQLKNELLNDGTYYYGTERAISKLIENDPDGLDKALNDNGIIDQDTLVDWLKSRIKENVDEGYYDYLLTKVNELDKVTDSSD